MPDHKFSPEPWMGTREIAMHLGVTIVTVRKWITGGKIPCHRMGKLWKFNTSEVDEWITNGDKGEEQQL